MDQPQKADAAIRNHVVYATAAGLIPVPIGDVLAVTALQVDLVKTLSNVYEQDFTASLGKALVSSLTGATVARLAASSVKAIPGVGAIAGGAAQAGLAGASTYAVGHLFKNHFAGGGTLDTFNPAKARELYEKYVEKGKSVVDQICRDHQEGGPTSVDRAADTIEKLARLRDSGDLTADEFHELKRIAIEQVS